jgi:hypothetical protein
VLAVLIIALVFTIFGRKLYRKFRKKTMTAQSSPVVMAR